LYKIHPELIRIINLYKKTDNKGNRRSLYLSLISFFKATNTDDLIITDEKVENLIKEPDFDEFAISLFKHSDDGFSPVEYEDVFDFLSQLKEEALVKIKNDQNMSAEALVFMVVSEIDPQGSGNLKKYREEVFSQLEKDPNLNPWNVVRGIGQMSLGAYVEAKIAKRPLTFWRSLFVGIATSLTLDFADSNLRGGIIPSTKGEIEDIVKLLKQAEDGIKEAGLAGGASKQEEDQIRELVLKAVDIVRTQFRENMESEGFKMSMKDKVGAFEQVSVHLTKANVYFDPSNFSITKDNWKEQSRNIQYFRNSLIETYERYKVSLSDFNIFEEQSIRCIRQISNIKIEYKAPTSKELERVSEACDSSKATCEIADIRFNTRELTDSGLSEEDINALVEIYGITADNIFTKFEKFKEFGDFVQGSLSRGSRQRGKFMSDFRREIENLRRPYENVGEVDADNMYLDPEHDYADNAKGMYCDIPGRGAIIKNGRQLCAIYCPDLRSDEPQSASSHQYFGYPAYDEQSIAGFLYAFSLHSSSAVFQRATATLKSSRLPAPFKNLIGSQKSVWIGRPGQAGNSKRVLDNAMIKLQNAKNNRGNLMAILAIHDLCWKVINTIYDGGQSADQNILAKLAAGETDAGLAHIALKFFFTWAEMDYFLATNGVSFFRSKHIFK